jgi:hypothetical protein
MSTAPLATRSTTRSLRAALLAASLAVGGLALPGYAATIVAPGGFATTEGDSNNTLPFSAGGLTSMRYQQVYAAADFALLNPAGGTITQILFRPDGSYGGVSGTIPSIRIDLSTTTVNENTMTSSFALNRGADATIVYGGATGAPLTLSSAFTGPDGGPKAFDIVINLSTPFFYRPSLGNLLLDVHVYTPEDTGIFDATYIDGDGTARLNSYNDGGDSTFGYYDTGGLITAFTATPAPEPGTAGLLLLGGTALLGLRRSRS